MRICRVLGDRQIGCVAEDFVQHVVRFAFGGDDDLRAVGRVLIGDMGVGGQTLVREIAAQPSCGDGLAANGEPLPITGRECACTESAGQRKSLVIVDDRQIRRAQRLLPHVPFRRPGQDVVQAAEFGSSLAPRQADWL